MQIIAEWFSQGQFHFSSGYPRAKGSDEIQDLMPAGALELYDVLLHGTSKDHPAGRFATPTMGLFCSVAVCDFLHRFATKKMNVPKSFFFPEDLARVLYTQWLKRVLAIRCGRMQKVYIRPHDFQ